MGKRTKLFSGFLSKESCIVTLPRDPTKDAAAPPQAVNPCHRCYLTSARRVGLANAFRFPYFRVLCVLCVTRRRALSHAEPRGVLGRAGSLVPLARVFVGLWARPPQPEAQCRLPQA